MKKYAMVLGTMGTMISPVMVMAQEGTGTANTAVTTAMQTAANDMLATGNAIVPIALTVVGLGLVVTFGLRIFNKIKNK